MSSGFFIKSLTLTHFRNYRHASLHVEPSSIVLTGANGAGKTNVLEAISCLSRRRGLRNAESKDMAHRPIGVVTDVPFWGVFAQLHEPHGESQRAIEWSIDKNQPTRIRKRQHEQGIMTPDKALPMLWLSPGADRYSAASRNQRRVFFDHLVTVTDSEQMRRLSRYEHIMRERTRILRDYGYGKRQELWLETLEHEMAQQAVAIAAARKVFADHVNRELAHNYKDNDLHAYVQLDGFIENTLGESSALKAESHFQDYLAQNRQQDSLSGRVQEGVHRSLIVVKERNRGLEAEMCSTGEQKMLTLALILATARLVTERMGRPIVLLDEIVAHLDRRRSGQFFALLFATQCQAWMTGIAKTLFSVALRSVQGFDIESGRFVPWQRRRLWAVP